MNKSSYFHVESHEICLINKFQVLAVVVLPYVRVSLMVSVEVVPNSVYMW